MNFGSALAKLRLGNTLTRKSWRINWSDEDPKPGKVVRIMQPLQHSRITEPYIYVVYEDDTCIPWIPTHSDLLAKDWELV